MARGPNSSGHCFNFIYWTRWDWARVFLKICNIAIFLSMIYATFNFWLVPKEFEYPGVGNEIYPSAGIKDLAENSTRFFKNYKLGILLHLASIGASDLLGWVLSMIAFTLTYMLISKIYDIASEDIVKLGPRYYVNLTMGSLLIGIILLSSSLRDLQILNRVYSAITIAILTFVLIGLERLRKSILTSQ